MALYGPQDFNTENLPTQLNSSELSNLGYGSTPAAPTADSGNFHPSQTPTHAPINAPESPNFSSIQSAIMAQQSPYMSFGAHGFLQDHAPKLAGVLDNAFLTLSNLQQGRTTGENVAAVARSLVAGRQERLQHNIQQATLPLQMNQQQIAYQQGLQNLYKTSAETDMDIQHAKYLGQHGDYFDARVDQLGQHYGSKMNVDDNGEPWAMVNGQLQYAGNNQLPPGYQPSFKTAGQRAQTSGNTLWGNIAQAADQPGAAPAQNAANRLNLYGKVQGGVAGGKAAAVDVANQPRDTAKDFLASEKDKVASSLGKRPTAADQKEYEQNELLKQLLSPGAQVGNVKSLEDRQKEYDQRAGDLKGRLSRYVQSNDWRKGKSFDPSLYGAPQATPPAQALAPNSNPYR